MIDTIAAIESIKKVDEALGVIWKLVAKLKAKPDLAALKLVEALDEIGKTWQVMDTAITQFLKLGLDDDALKSKSDVLLRIEGGGLLAEVQDGRGHCIVIRIIYEKYLNRWFMRVFNNEESGSISRVFNLLGDADDRVFYDMEKVAGQLQKEATHVLDMVSVGKFNEAKSKVLAFRKELQPLRLGMSGTLQTLYRLKSEFIQIAGLA